MKRLTCSRCHAANDYDVPTNEAMAPQRDVKCRGCGHHFIYGFAPELVTEAERPARDLEAPIDLDLAAEAVRARERLERHLARHPEYADRDRDILLLYQIDQVDQLSRDLTALRRTLDVIAKRSAGK
jgi:DNA-directed RNA polymerase subunit RPC12/RpoP